MGFSQSVAQVFTAKEKKCGRLWRRADQFGELGNKLIHSERSNEHYIWSRIFFKRLCDYCRPTGNAHVIQEMRT